MPLLPSASASLTPRCLCSYYPGRFSEHQWQLQASSGRSPGQIVQHVLVFFTILDVHQQFAQLLLAWPPSQEGDFSTCMTANSSRLHRNPFNSFCLMWLFYLMMFQYINCHFYTPCQHWMVHSQTFNKEKRLKRWAPEELHTPFNLVKIYRMSESEVFPIWLSTACLIYISMHSLGDWVWFRDYKYLKVLESY